MTTGQILTATLRTYFSIGPRTLRYRNGQNLVDSMLEAMTFAATVKGYYSETTERAFAPGWPVTLAWQKNVKGYRLPGEITCALNQMRPYKISSIFGDMVDAGVTNCYEAEAWFKANIK